MKSTKSLVMAIKTLNLVSTLILFWITISACEVPEKSKFHTFPEAQNDKLIFHLGTLVNNDSCIYELKSNYLDEKVFSGRFYFHDNNAHIKLTPETQNFDTLFSLAHPEKEQKFSAIHRNWEIERGDSLSTTEYTALIDTVLIIDSVETITKVVLKDFISAFPQLGPLDGVVFFSTKRGFIGSYYLSDIPEKLILAKEGDILQTILNYDEYIFRRFQ